MSQRSKVKQELPHPVQGGGIPSGHNLTYRDRRSRSFTVLKHTLNPTALGQWIENLVLERDGRDNWLAAGAMYLRRSLTEFEGGLFRLLRWEECVGHGNVPEGARERLLSLQVEGDCLWERWQDLICDCQHFEGDRRLGENAEIQGGGALVEHLLGSAEAFADSAARSVLTWMKDVGGWCKDCEREWHEWQ